MPACRKRAPGQVSLAAGKRQPNWSGPASKQQSQPPKSLSRSKKSKGKQPAAEYSACRLLRATARLTVRCEMQSSADNPFRGKQAGGSRHIVRRCRSHTVKQVR